MISHNERKVGVKDSGCKREGVLRGTFVLCRDALDGVPSDTALRSTQSVMPLKYM